MRNLRSSFIVSFIGMAVFALIGAGTSYAALGDGMELWGMNIKPYVEVTQMYDSNIFLDDLDAKDDWITMFEVGGDVEVNLTKDILVIGGYEFGYDWFADHDEESNFSHRAYLSYDWVLTHFEIVVEDVYNRFSDRSGTEDTGRISRQNNLLTVDLLTEKDQLEFDFGYDFLIEDYLSNDFVSGTNTYDAVEDRIEHVFRGEVAYRFLPKTSFLMEGKYGLVEYDNAFNSDSYFISALTGLRGEVLRNGTLDIKGGFHLQDYERGSDKDYIGAVAQGVLTKPFGDDDTVSLVLEHSVNESTYRNNSHYVMNFLGAGYVHRFNPKISANLAGSIQRNNYPKVTTEGLLTGKRWDNLYTAQAGLIYDIQKWLTTEVGYKWTQKESKFATFDYIDHLVTASGLLKF